MDFMEGQKRFEILPTGPTRVDAAARRAFYEQLALAHLPAMRVLFRGGKLWRSSKSKTEKQDQWRNVAEHCLAAGAAMAILAEALGFSEKDTNRSVVAALCHDWDKRRDRKPDDFSGEDVERAKALLHESGADSALLFAGGPKFLKVLARDREHTTFAQRLQFYVDDITYESDILRLQDYVARIRAGRRKNLDEDAALTKELGKPFWDATLEVSGAIEEEVFEALKARGIEIAKPEEVPDFINQRLAERIAAVVPSVSPASPEGSGVASL